MLIMIELVLVSKNLEDEQKVLSRESPSGYYFSFLDLDSKLCRADAFALKSEWGAREDPFALVKDKDKVLRCFYSEKSNNVIDEALEFIKCLQESYD
jgi:hypothetical protein